MGFSLFDSFETKDPFTSDMPLKDEQTIRNGGKRRSSLSKMRPLKSRYSPPSFAAPTNPYQQELYHQTLQQEIYKSIVPPLSIMTVSEVTQPQSSMACSICAELYDTNPIAEKPLTLPCNHTFGSRCIERWLDESPTSTCPNCRSGPYTITSDGVVTVSHTFLAPRDSRGPAISPRSAAFGTALVPGADVDLMIDLYINRLAVVSARGSRRENGDSDSDERWLVDENRRMLQYVQRINRTQRDRDRSPQAVRAARELMREVRESMAVLDEGIMGR